MATLTGEEKDSENLPKMQNALYHKNVARIPIKDLQVRPDSHAHFVLTSALKYTLKYDQNTWPFVVYV